MRDFDQFIEEECKRGNGIDLEPLRGWIYKTADELAEECMMTISRKTMREHLKKLTKRGWILERDNPRFKWDHTKQYRVDIVKLQADLIAIGYYLKGYKLDVSEILKKEPKEKKIQGKRIAL
ncbi:hypothetical protein [Evansella tamaricis]|uniref:Uncharacterized protein n=1 Tax=Evansella tamaricis TaxID=2069301 RepID=A0ABS6JKP5_9BACI|nr:hypothetical protein [Evansella tamaricis]MBU9714123.1 hypothetical protein [Evansella tamaricis]